MSKVIPFSPAHERKALCPDGLTPAVLWPLQDLEQPNGDDWLLAAVEGSRCEGAALSIWAHHPNLKRSTRKFASLITPRWPTSRGASLLEMSVQAAVTMSLDAMDRGEAITGRLVGTYLHGLASGVADIARLAVYGVDRAGERRRWEYFTQPLKDWADSNGMSTLAAHLVDPEPTDVTVAGLRTHLIASIAHPLDAGYVAKYADAARHNIHWEADR